MTRRRSCCTTTGQAEGLVVSRPVTATPARHPPRPAPRMELGFLTPGIKPSMQAGTEGCDHAGATRNFCPGTRSLYSGQDTAGNWPPLLGLLGTLQGADSL
eukprot:CAMPEP_0195081738 /NCGR_PEP_ID=MMETSP0448-20130528/23109_1 /TAXON_ID=66468 /ORGANISM="Heterocapsa triquestra, Strain CCMP 448" /LENGTH=100 /DNA_ID=CAMNT_0040114785 /DNA_START=81 /DNA_END=379 /DNA_ORIENTATION=+